jgi:DNA (cytosine-5)-methyltransferase 1
MNAVSLFAGVGGFDLAFERNGVEVVASVEIDANARGVLRRQFPHTKQFNDICNVTGKDLINAGFKPSEGIIVGGFPCQDLSVAGKRAGLEGKRSGLFWEIVRLLEETKSQFFILENVPGLLSSQGGADMELVVNALDDLGYGIAWRVLDAQHFGVPQRRRRIFIVGSLGDNGSTSAKILALSEGRTRYLESSKSKRENSAREIEQRAQGYRESSFGQFAATLESATLKAKSGVAGGGERNIIDSLTVADLTKSMTSNQAVSAGLLQVMDQ